MARLETSLQRINHWDAALAVRCNQACRLGFVREALRVASRLGDGVFWYGLMLIMPLTYGYAALGAVARMVLAGALGVAVYKLLKTVTSRPRPCEVYAVITAQARPLDRFSFPSGHTLHAVSFSTIATAYFPELGPPLWSFTAVVAASRPTLGLHYPSDVLAGGLIGWAIARAALSV